VTSTWSTVTGTGCPSTACSQIVHGECRSAGQAVNAGRAVSGSAGRHSGECPFEPALSSARGQCVARGVPDDKDQGWYERVHSAQVSYPYPRRKMTLWSWRASWSSSRVGWELQV